MTPLLRRLTPSILLIFLFFFLFSFTLASAALTWTGPWGGGGGGSGDSNYSNYSNSSDYWDNLDTPMDFTNASFFYIKLNENTGACDLTTNGTICKNATGIYIVG